jgi:hypothetical protein
MNMPGFTAEASLYKTSECYQCAAEWMNNSNDKAIIPQIPWWVLPIYCHKVPLPGPIPGTTIWIWVCGGVPV